MKTKYIDRVYTHGYTLAPVYRAIDIEPGGTIESGLTLTGGHRVSVIDNGAVEGAEGVNGGKGSRAAGGPGLTMTGTARLAGGGFILGGAGGDRYGETAGAGGAGVSLASAASLTTAGIIMGGEGGYNSDVINDFGGVGGAGVALSSRSTLKVTTGTITGGTGGGGFTFESFGSDAGAGGAGVYLATLASLTTAGTVVGGEGGQSFFGGAGGAGVALGVDASMTNTGMIAGGGGGAVIDGTRGAYAGSGGAGVSLAAGASMANFGTIAGGIAGPLGQYGEHPGTAGNGVNVSAGATVINGHAQDRMATIDGLIGVSVAGAGTLIDFGTIVGTGETSVAFTNDADARLIVETGAVFMGAVVGGHGTLELAGKNGTITGLGDTGTLSGAATMTFSGFGSYDFDAGSAWTVTGANIVSGPFLSGSFNNGGSFNNAGSLTIANKALLKIKRPVRNDGVIKIEGKGKLFLGGAVSGAGTALINGGTLDALSSFTQNVTFDSSGELGISDATAYNGSITGFSQTGGTSLKLGDIGFVGADEATFSGTMSGGVLTVTDGVHTANINLSGDYLSTTFIAFSDGNGGTDVTAQNTDRPAGPPHAFIAAIAAFGAPAASHALSGRPEAAREVMLSSPRIAIA